MFEYMLAGGGIAIAGMLVGFLAGRLARKPKITSPTCGCGHTIGFHKDHVGKCQNSTWGACRCQKYDGPKPFETLYAPEIAP